MKPKTLLILSVTAVILVIIAGVNRSRTLREREKTSTHRREILFPDLNVNEVEKIIVTTSGEEVVVARHEDKWVCESRENYPANFDKIRSALMTIAELKHGELRIANASPDQKRAFHALSPRAENDDEEQGTGRKIELLDKNNNTISSFVLGRTYTSRSAPHTPDMFQMGASASGRFIAVGDNIHLVTESLHRLDDKSVSWLDADLLNVPADNIVAMRVEDTEGNSIEMKRPEPGGDFVVTDMSENEEIRQWAANGLARTFAHLTFSDMPGSEIEDSVTGLDSPVTLWAKAEDGKVYVLSRGNRVPGKTENYAKLMVTLDNDRIAERIAEKREASDDVDETEIKNKINEEVDALNTMFKKWTYTIPAHRADNITTDRENFLKPKPEPAEEPEPTEEPEHVEEAESPEEPAEEPDPEEETAEEPAEESGVEQNEEEEE